MDRASQHVVGWVIWVKVSVRENCQRVKKIKENLCMGNRAGKMARQLRVFDAPSENPSSVPSTHICGFITIHNSGSRISDALFMLPWTLHAYSHTHRHTHINNKVNLSKQ